MNYTTDTKYMRLFLMLLYSNNSLNVFDKEQQSYIVHLTYLFDHFKHPFEYNYSFNGELQSDQVNNALLFIAADYDGIINELKLAEAFGYEKILANYISEVIGEEQMKDTEYIKLLSQSLYFKKLSNATNYSDVKKYVTKQKVDNVPLDKIKSIWKQLSSIEETLKKLNK